jgi:hypothetical protein
MTTIKYRNREEQIADLFLRHDIFVNEARNAARQSLFFLGMLWPLNNQQEPHRQQMEKIDNCWQDCFLIDYSKANKNFSNSTLKENPVEEYRHHALHQIKGLIRGVCVPTVYSDEPLWPGNLGENEDDRKIKIASYSEIVLEDKWNEWNLDIEKTNDILDAIKLSIKWTKLRKCLPNAASSSDGCEIDCVPIIRSEIVNFIKETDKAIHLKFYDKKLPKAFIDDSKIKNQFLQSLVRWIKKNLTRTNFFINVWKIENQFLQSLVRWIKKNLTQILIVLSFSVSIWKIEALHSLLLNDLLMKIVIIIMTVSILYQHFSNIRIVKKKIRDNNYEEIKKFDIGEHAFFDNNAVEPSPYVKRWPDCQYGWKAKNDIRREITINQLLKFAMRSLLMAILVIIAMLADTITLNRLPDAPVSSCIVALLFYAIFQIAYILDFWNFVSEYAIRLWMVSLISIGLIFSFFLNPLYFPIVLLIASAAIAISACQHRHMVLTLLFFCIAILIAFSIKNNMIREPKWSYKSGDSWRLKENKWPFPGTDPLLIIAASGGGSRAAIYTAKTLQHLNKQNPEIARNLQLISSVSGGSLASAAYIAAKSKKIDELIVPYHIDDVEIDMESVVKAMQDDFLKPTIIGALNPFTNRGDAIENEWNNGKVKLSKLSLKEIKEQWEEAFKFSEKLNYPPFPIPMFNSTTLQGHTVIITPLTKIYYTREYLHNEAISENKYEKLINKGEIPAWVYYRTGIYGLDDLIGTFNPTLSQSVRASANFPFGFPLVRLKSEKKVPIFSPDRKFNKIKLTDGGALSNSGILPIYQLLINRFKDLKKRGVLLLVVEASKMPKYAFNPNRTIKNLLGTIDDKNPKGQRMHHLIFKLLTALYMDRIAIVQIDLEPKDKYNIMTTWSLDKNKIKDLDTTFGNQWPKVQKEIEKKWKKLEPNEFKTDKKNNCSELLLKNYESIHKSEWWWRSPLH